MNKKKDQLIAEIIAIPDPEPGTRMCDAPGCRAAGEYRAPQARDRLNDYYWFCLEHVREYNRAWNYYKGMSQVEIERHIRWDTTWQRPTWPFAGKRKNGAPDFDLGAFGPEDWDIRQAREAQAGTDGWRPRPHSDEARALDEFRMEAPVTREGVKTRYKELVKEHHPDAHGGAKDAEEKLKAINHAYSVLMACQEIA